MDFTLAIPVLAGGIRSVAGWFENSMKDGKFDAYEVKLLLSTIVEVGLLSLSAMYALGLDAASASGFSILASYGLSALKKAVSK